MADLPLLKIAVQARDGHRWQVLGLAPSDATSRLLWLPAMGVAAKHYVPFAQALAARGIAVFIHDWRGIGSSSVRPARDCDWGYRELLTLDLPATEEALRAHGGGLPWILGGHSLGGQLACCFLGLDPARASRLWLVASGSPYWRSFPMRARLWLPFAYRFLPWLTDRRGFLPGHRIGFGGNESRSLIRDWARSALNGRYAAQGLDADLDAAMANVRAKVHALVLAQDWLAPESSTRFLLSKMPAAGGRIERIDPSLLGTRAGHFEWMKQPEAIADTLLRD